MAARKPAKPTPVVIQTDGPSLSLEDLMVQRTLTITIDKDDNVEFHFPGMSVYEAESLTYRVHERLTAQIEQVWCPLDEGVE